MANSELVQYREKLYANYRTVAIYNLPASLKSPDVVIAELEVIS